VNGTINYRFLANSVTASGSNGNASIGIGFEDEFIFSSSELPLGTTLDFEVTADFSDTLSGGCPEVNGFPTALATASLSTTGFSGIVDSECSPLDPSQRMRSVILHPKVGDTLNISQTLIVHALSLPGQPGAATGSNGGNGLTVELLTSGAEFHTGSGTIYSASPVPEPATGALFGLACIAMAVVRAGDRSRRLG
jgi:hypothetical protein